MKRYLAVPDPALPAAELLLDPDALLAQLSQEQRLASQNFSALELASIRYKPGTSCLVGYRAVADNATTYLHAKAFQRADWPTRKQKIDDALVVNDDHCFAVWQFPVDSKLSACHRLVEEPEEFIDRLLFEGVEGGPFTDQQVLAYKPNRRLVLKLVRQTHGSLVVKLHDKRTFKAAVKAAKALKSASSVAVPPRVGRSNRHRMLAYEWVDGQPLCVDVGETDLRQQIRLVFDWLARLRSAISFKKLRKLPLIDPMPTVRQHVDDLSTICPDMAALIESVGSAVLDGRPPTMKPTLSHGDFHRRQVLFDADTIRVLDFDNLCIGDMTTDIGNFVAHLLLEAVRDPGRSDAAAKVDQICRNEIKRHEAEMVAPYHWNVAFSMLRLSTQLFRSGDPQWQSHTWRWLEAIEERLAQCDAPPASRCTKSLPEPLSQSLRPEKATTVFRSKLGSIKRSFGDYFVNQIDVVRHKPGRRCLLEFHLVTSQGPVQILGKYRAKGLDRHSLSIAQNLHRKFGFSGDSVDQVSVPKPLGKYRPWNMWFQEKIDAETVAARMQAGRLSECLGPIAKAAFKLHQCSMECERQHSVEDELRILRKQLDAVARDNRNLQPDLQQILAASEELATRIDRSLTTPIHRDYYQDQLLINDRRCWLIDLDLVTQGHPATDIGNFCAHLIEDGLRNHSDARYWDPQRLELTDRYLQLNAKCSGQDIEIFEALSLARHIGISWRITERRTNLPDVLSEVHQRLDRIINSKSSVSRESGVTT